MKSFINFLAEAKIKTKTYRFTVNTVFGVFYVYTKDEENEQDARVDARNFILSEIPSHSGSVRISEKGKIVKEIPSSASEIKRSGGYGWVEKAPDGVNA